MSLIWKSTRPATPGWYWVRTNEGREEVREFVRQGATAQYGARIVPKWIGNYVAWAGPIAKPREPSREQLATVRWKLYCDRICGYYTDTEWLFCDRAEIERRANVELFGDRSYYSQPVEPDAKRVYIQESRKVNGRWKNFRRVEWKPAHPHATAFVQPEAAHA